MLFTLASYVTIGRWAVFAVLSLFCIVAFIGNMVTFYKNTRDHEDRWYGGCAGGLAGVAALLVMPIGTIGSRLWFLWIPLLLEIWTLFVVLLLPYTIAKFMHRIVWGYFASDDSPPDQESR